jgi:lipopolysaccharide biosynthesis glycosyltransferase
MNGKQIHIGIAFDQNYLAPFHALLTSIISNNQSGPIAIHAIATGVDETILLQIKSYVSDNKHDIFFYTIDEKQLSHFTLNDNWTHAVYYRLLFPFLIPGEVERLLYIDTDTLVVNDLRPLYDTPLEGFPVGAVYDNYVVNNPAIGIEGEGNYFNSGMLLMDIPKWKEQQISERAFDYLNKYPERISYVDQDALNAVLKDNWKKLPLQFNVLYSYIPQDIARSALDTFISDKTLLHFTLQRPWNSLCRNRYRGLYFRYLKSSCSPKQKKYTDFNLSKLLPMLTIRLKEFYFDQPLLRGIWRSLKNIVSNSETKNTLQKTT